MSVDETPDPYADARMSVFEHLRELRVRFLKSFVAIAVGFGICWTWAEPLFQFLLIPLQNAAPEAELAQMHHKDLAEPFFVLLKTSILGGVFIALPVVIFQLWSFVSPGLYDHEKKTLLPFMVSSFFFFLLGSTFCFVVVMPQGYEFLLGFSETVSQPELMMSEYLGLTSKLLIGFGIIFQLPIVTSFMAKVGLITHRHLITYWRHSVVASFIVAAILTPPDVVTQVLMAVPLCVLYFLSIGVAWYFTRQNERKAARESAMSET